MTKGLKYGALSLAASALLASSAMAGTITQSNRDTVTGGDAYIISKQLHTANAAAGTVATIGATSLQSYTPTAIPLGTLTDPAFNIASSSGVLTVPANTVLCTAAINGAVVGTYAAGSGTTAVVFQAPAGGSTISNNVAYFFGVDAAADGTCDGIPSAITLTLPQGSTASALTISAGTAATQVIHDTATATVVSTVEEYSASNTGLLDAKIDAADDFLSFTGAVAADVLTTTISRAYTDATVAEATDVWTLTLNSTVALPTVTVTAVDTTTAAAASVTANAADTSWVIVGNAALAADTNTFVTTLTTDGATVIPETTFTSSLSADFSAGTNSGTQAVQTDVAAGNWSIFGYNGTIPHVSVATGTSTVVKLNNASTTDAAVYWTVADNEGNTVSNLQVPSATSGLTGLAAGKGAAWDMADVYAAAVAQNASFGTAFRATVVVPTTPSSVSAVALMQIDGARDRVIPVLHANTSDYMAE